MSTSKSKGKSKAPAGSSKQDVASRPKGEAKLPVADFKIVGDLHVKQVWIPQGPSLINDPFELWDNQDWVKQIQDLREFEVEYSHYRRLWDEAGCEERLRQTFDGIRRSIPLNQCVSVGLGNFAEQTLVPVQGHILEGRNNLCGPRDRIRVLNPTLHQLMFLRRSMRFLGIPREKVYFQEPNFTKFEKAYLKHSFHDGCILNARIGEDCPSGAQDQMTPKTFLMAPGTYIVLSEILEPTAKAPGLYMGNKMLRMIQNPPEIMKPEDIRQLNAPLNKYSVVSTSKPIPTFIEGFEWTNECEIRYRTAQKTK